MIYTDEQEKIASRIIEALSDADDERIATKDSLMALSIVTGLVVGQAGYTLEQRATLLGLMTIAMVNSATPDEEEDEE